MEQPKHLTINVWFAKETHKALIITKYPKGTYQMTMWNLETDQFTRGQWVRNKKIKMDRCGLSPDGNYFAYFMFDIKNSMATFTVISKTPYFTGLYCQEEEGTWTGGAYFHDNNTIVMKPYIVILNRMPGNFSVYDPSPPGSNSGGGRRDERSLSFHKTSCTDPLGRTITIHDNTLFIDGVEGINFEEDIFTHVKAPY